MRGRDGWGVWNGHLHTAIFSMDKQQGPTVPYREQSTGTSAQCYMVAWMGGEFGAE